MMQSIGRKMCQTILATVVTCKHSICFIYLYWVIKFKNKNWGKIRLGLELKKRSISKKNIEIAMKQISQSIYEAKFKERFNFLTEKLKNEKKIIMKKKIFDYFNYRGWEHEIIYNEINKL